MPLQADACERWKERDADARAGDFRSSAGRSRGSVTGGFADSEGLSFVRSLSSGDRRGPNPGAVQFLFLFQLSRLRSLKAVFRVAALQSAMTWSS